MFLSWFARRSRKGNRRAVRQLQKRLECHFTPSRNRLPAVLLFLVDLDAGITNGEIDRREREVLSEDVGDGPVSGCRPRQRSTSRRRGSFPARPGSYPAGGETGRPGRQRLDDAGARQRRPTDGTGLTLAHNDPAPAVVRGRGPTAVDGGVVATLMPERIRGNGFTDPDDRHVRGGSWSVRFAGPYRRSQYTRRTEPDIVMSFNGPRKEVRKTIGDAHRRAAGDAYAGAGPGEVTPYGGNGGVLQAGRGYPRGWRGPLRDRPGGERRERGGGVPGKDPEPGRCQVRIRRGRYAGDRTLTGIRTPDGERGGSDMDRDGHGRGGQRQRTRLIAGKPRG